MNKMMNLQADFEKYFASPTAIFYILPIMKNFPTQLMRAVRTFTAVFNGFLEECLTSHLETYNPSQLKPSKQDATGPALCYTGLVLNCVLRD